MRNFVKLLVLTILCLVSQFISSQEKSTTEERAETLTRDMQKKIGFSDEVKDQVYQINLEFVMETQKLKSEEDLSKVSKFRTLKKLDSERDYALEKIFTEEELKAFKEFKIENRESLKERYKSQN